MNRSALSLTIGMAVLLVPTVSFAATDTTNEILEDLDATSDAPIIEPAPAPILDGKGGGMGGGGIMYPGGGGVTVETSVTREVTPDFLNINAYCDSGKQGSRDAAKAFLDKIYEDIKMGVGKDGRVRRSGSVSVYPYYERGDMQPSGDSYAGSLSIMVRILNAKAALRISDLIESKGCGVNWDVRLLDPQTHELGVLNDLTSRLNQRKKVFEKLLGKRLTNVTGLSLYTYVDGYSSYDPETNKADATTTLSVTFEIGSRVTLPSSSSSVAPAKEPAATTRPTRTRTR